MKRFLIMAVSIGLFFSISVSADVYFVPYIGDIDGGIDSDWFGFYEQLREWHDANFIPVGLSFYPMTMNNDQFNNIIADMYFSENVELITKGEDKYNGKRIDLMSYSEVREAVEVWQNKFIRELENLGYSNIRAPVTYNQLMGRFTETIRDAVHDLGFKIYLEQYVSEYGNIGMLPDFDITQYSVSLTTSGGAGPSTEFKTPEQVIQELLDFYDERLIYINGVKVVPLLSHQQDFRVSYQSSTVDQRKWDIYTRLLLMARDDPRIYLLKPGEVYDLRHPSNGICGNNVVEYGEECDGSNLAGETCESLGFDSGTLLCKDCFFDVSDCKYKKVNKGFVLTDFETGDGWSVAGSGQGKFEIGVPRTFSRSEGQCRTTCLGKGISSDHTEIGEKAVCTNLDGYMGRFETLSTNSLTSPVYDFSGKKNINLELWRFMEIEGNNYDFCYYQYKNSPTSIWTTFETYGTAGIDDNSWGIYTRDLSSLADGLGYFQLRFYCTTDDWTEGSGLCLDDIKISWESAITAVCGNNIVEEGEECELDDIQMRQCGVSDVGECEYGQQTRTCSGGCTWNEWSNCIGNVNPVKEMCDDGKDNDCDGSTDLDDFDCLNCIDNDKDNYYATAGDCPIGDDCNDNDAAIHPGASETACNGIDDDCDGLKDEDYVSQQTSCGVGACYATGSTSCVGGLIVNSCTPGMPSPEVCEGSIDEDCDGTVDEGCVCTPGQTRNCAQQNGVCAGSQETCNAQGQWPGCDYSAIPNYQAIESSCDNLDNDCDGNVDEGCAATSICQYASSATATSEYSSSLASYAIGAPNAPKVGQCNGWNEWSGYGYSWAPTNWNVKATLTLNYNTPVYARNFTIYGDYDMCWNRIWLRNGAAGQQNLVFSGYDENCISTHKLNGDFLANTIILETCGWSWSATDSVELCGEIS